MQQQQQKLQRLAAAAAAAAQGGKRGAAAAAAAGFAPQEVEGMQQLLQGLGGLRLRRLFWAVVQGELPVRQSGTLRNRWACGLALIHVLLRDCVSAGRSAGDTSRILRNSSACARHN
jgi:hypothetical protein